MKHLFTFILVVALGKSYGQNLVPNPSFEEYDTCPTTLNHLYLAFDWSISLNSVDYYNACGNPSQAGVPSNVNGYQNPITGSAYAGFIGKGRNGAQIEAREYLGAKLSSALIIGERYYASFYVNVVDYNYCFANKIGALFTNNFLGDTTIIPAPLMNNFAHVFTDSIITDTLLWTKVSGSFIADSAYQYIMIGNFFDDSHIDTIVTNGPPCVTYYYIDDVCVSSDSTICDWHTEVSIIANKERIYIYPNPSIDLLNIFFPVPSEFGVFNILGQEVYHDNEEKKEAIINTSILSNGVYLICAKANASCQVIKFLIQK